MNMPSKEEIRAAKMIEITQQLDAALLSKGRDNVDFRVMPGRRGLTEVRIKRKIIVRPRGENGGDVSPS